MSKPRNPKITLRDPSRPPPDFRGCDWPGCEDAGDFRAPKSRDRLHDYYWFCLHHVRLYNASWNYYEGMSPDEIEREVQNDTTWRRPTWKLGEGKLGEGAPPRGQKINGFSVKDGFGLFEDGEASPADAPLGMADSGLSPAERQALATLNLQWPLSRDDLRTRYKELSKRYHPDATGGDKQAEERFKMISAAYSDVSAVLDRLDA